MLSTVRRAIGMRTTLHLSSTIIEGSAPAPMRLDPLFSRQNDFTRVLYSILRSCCHTPSPLPISDLFHTLFLLRLATWLTACLTGHRLRILSQSKRSPLLHYARYCTSRCWWWLLVSIDGMHKESSLFMAKRGASIANAHHTHNNKVGSAQNMLSTCTIQQYSKLYSLNHAERRGSRLWCICEARERE